MTKKSAYEQLKERFADIRHLGNAGSILYNDMQVSMPKGSGADRSHQMIILDKMAHRLIADPEVENWLDEAERSKAGLGSEDQRNLHLMRKAWVEQAGLPEDLVEELSRIGSEGDQKHTKLKSTGDWSQMKSWYEHTFSVAQRLGEIKKDKLGLSSPYEALLDGYCPEMSAQQVEGELKKIGKALPALVQEATQKQSTEPKAIPLKGPFPVEQQQELFRRIVTAMGFDFDKGRLDVLETHPCCGGTSDDTRLTADLSEDNFLNPLYSAIHEAGHGIYEQNTPENWRYQPAGSSFGMVIHESQSRIMELHACGSPEFFAYLEKQVRDVFNRPNDPALSAENLQRLKRETGPSFIRIEADELTYAAHIILRHRLESGMINGTLGIDDLEQAWNDGMQELLGITPPDASKGCMQDTHWPCGLIGYFPAYTLGDVAAAQLFEAACKKHPEIPAEIGKGNFEPLTKWLNENVHGKGGLLSPDELLTQATGAAFNAQAFLDHLSQRFTGKSYETPGNGKSPDTPKP